MAATNINGSNSGNLGTVTWDATTTEYLSDGRGLIVLGSGSTDSLQIQDGGTLTMRDGDVIVTTRSDSFSGSQTQTSGYDFALDDGGTLAVPGGAVARLKKLAGPGSAQQAMYGTIDLGPNARLEIDWLRGMGFRGDFAILGNEENPPTIAYKWGGANPSGNTGIRFRIDNLNAQTSFDPRAGWYILELGSRLNTTQMLFNGNATRNLIPQAGLNLIRAIRICHNGVNSENFVYRFPNVNLADNSFLANNIIDVAPHSVGTTGPSDCPVIIDTNVSPRTGQTTFPRAGFNQISTGNSGIYIYEQQMQFQPTDTAIPIGVYCPTTGMTTFTSQNGQTRVVPATQSYNEDDGTGTENTITLNTLGTDILLTDITSNTDVTRTVRTFYYPSTFGAYGGSLNGYNVSRMIDSFGTITVSNNARSGNTETVNVDRFAYGSLQAEIGLAQYTIMAAERNAISVPVVADALITQSVIDADSSNIAVTDDGTRLQFTLSGNATLDAIAKAAKEYRWAQARQLPNADLDGYSLTATDPFTGTSARDWMVDVIGSFLDLDCDITTNGHNISAGATYTRLSVNGLTTTGNLTGFTLDSNNEALTLSGTLTDMVISNAANVAGATLVDSTFNGNLTGVSGNLTGLTFGPNVVITTNAALGDLTDITFSTSNTANVINFDADDYANAIYDIRGWDTTGFVGFLETDNGDLTIQVDATQAGNGLGNNGVAYTDGHTITDTSGGTIEFDIQIPVTTYNFNVNVPTGANGYIAVRNLTQGTTQKLAVTNGAIVGSLDGVTSTDTNSYRVYYKIDSTVGGVVYRTRTVNVQNPTSDIAVEPLIANNFFVENAVADANGADGNNPVGTTGAANGTRYNITWSNTDSSNAASAAGTQANVIVLANNESFFDYIVANELTGDPIDYRPLSVVWNNSADGVTGIATNEGVFNTSANNQTQNTISNAGLGIKTDNTTVAGAGQVVSVDEGEASLNTVNNSIRGNFEANQGVTDNRAVDIAQQVVDSLTDNSVPKLGILSKNTIE